MSDTQLSLVQSEYSKSNKLITAKYKSTLLENQVMAISLTRIKKVHEDGQTKLVARLYPGEIKRLIGESSHIARDLDKISTTMMSHIMYLESEPGEFDKHVLVKDAQFKNGVFTVVFHENMEKHITDLKSNYSRIELGVVAGLTKNATFRLYELLKKDVYRINEKTMPFVEVQYNLSELRFMLGLVNSDDPAVLRSMEDTKIKDWDAIYEKVSNKNKQYAAWGDLKRHVIEPAKNEIEEVGNLRFEYEPIRLGRKVHDIIFRIYKNKPTKQISQVQFALDEMKSKENETYRQLEFPYDTYKDFYDKYIGHNGLTIEDISHLIQEAGTDLGKIDRAIELADKQPYIGNYMGWIISCIRDDYGHTETIEGSAEKAEKARSVMTEYEQNKERTAVKVWEKCKKNDGYEDFLRDLENAGLEEEKFDTLYDAIEKTDVFFTWKKKGVIAL